MDAMPGDAEAAGAVAGMIELTGPQPIRRLWDSFVGNEWNSQRQGFDWALYPVDELPAKPCVACGAAMSRVFSSPWIGGVSTMPPERIEQLQPTRAKALADVIETLTRRREKLTDDIQRLKGELAAEIEGEGGYQ